MGILGEEGDNRTKIERESCFVGPLPSLRAATSLFVGFSIFGEGEGEGSTPRYALVNCILNPQTPADSGDIMEQ